VKLVRDLVDHARRRLAAQDLEGADLALVRALATLDAVPDYEVEANSRARPSDEMLGWVRLHGFTPGEVKGFSVYLDPAPGHVTFRCWGRDIAGKPTGYQYSRTVPLKAPMPDVRQVPLCDLHPEGHTEETGCARWR
jgi:hypothetical protein